MNLEQAQKMVKKTLSRKRFTHTMNVKKAAVELANRYGADPDKAALAAVLHDAAKEMPKDEMLRILQQNAIIAQNAQFRPTPVWHGVCAAILAQTQWDITDPEVLSAIACHTTGKPGMSKLDKIIYLSDMISEERDYPEVHQLRRMAQENLDTAVCTAVAMNLEWMRECGKTIDPLSEQALLDLQRLTDPREGNCHE